MANATIPKRSPGKAPDPNKEVHRAPAIEWTEEDRRAVIAKGREIQAKKHLHVRELITEAMRETLPQGKWREPKKWDFDRLQWFIEGIVTKEGPVETAVVERAARIDWTMEEKAELIAEGREIRRQNPKLGPRLVLARAQEAVLPPERRRTHIQSIPPARMKWYTDALAGDLRETAREIDLQELPPVHSPELVELPPVKSFRHPLGKTRKQRIFWSPHDLDQLLRAARRIRDETGLLNERRLLDRAQREVLPPERWRGTATMGGGVITYLLDKMREWPRFSVEPKTEPREYYDPQRAEGLRAALFDYAYPPPPPPEPIDIDAVVAEAVEQAVSETTRVGIVKAETEDLIAEMSRRAYFVFSELVNDVRGGLTALRDLQTSQGRDHELLMRLAQEWDPKLVAGPPAPPPVAETALNGRYDGEGVVVAEKPSMPRLKGILVGGAVEFGREVIGAVKAVLDLDHNPSSNNARNKGFKNYDCVFITPIAGHSATKVAKNEIGHENVFFIPQTSSARIAEEIRKWVSKKESKWMRAQAESN